MLIAGPGTRRALVVLALCVMSVSTADPLAQSEPPRGSDSPFMAVPVVNAPFVADAVTTVFPASGGPGATQTLKDRYYRDSAGRVRAERRTSGGELIIIDSDPGDPGVTLLKSDSQTFVRVSLALAQFHFHGGSNLTEPRWIFKHGVIMGGTRAAYDVAADLGLVVHTRRLHSRLGAVEFRLTNIRRSEPAPELFEVPSSYLPAPVGTKVDLELRER
jgi:hypothetical protein